MANEKLVDLARVSKCKGCGQKLVWLKSQRTEKMYPVEYHGELADGRARVTTNDFHNCPMRQKK